MKPEDSHKNPAINPNKDSLIQAKKLLDIPSLFEALKNGDRAALGRGITLIESTRVEDQEAALQLLSLCESHKQETWRIGITGTPGVGKSTFIERFGLHAISLDKKVAVLAIDPTSSKSKGSILGDKTRMELLVRSENAFIRPSPSGDELGGIARKTREAISLCEAAGYDLILIETVGVGQSGFEVHKMVDFFLLLLQPGAGDELQGMKRGIMEMADLITVNKADGDLLTKAKQAKKEVFNAIHLFPNRDDDWIVKVLLSSAINGHGMEDIWAVTESFFSQDRWDQYLRERRKNQNLLNFDRQWMNDFVQKLMKDPTLSKKIETLKGQITKDETSSSIAAKEILDYLNSRLND